MYTVNIQVKPGSSRDQIEQSPNGLVARIRARPVDGEANAYLLEFLAEALEIRRSEVTLLKGQTSRQKQIGFYLQEEEVRQKLEKLWNRK